MRNQLTPVHIVLVEDNPADVLLVEESLRLGGISYRIEVFHDGPEALAALPGEGGLPDLILLDLNLPKTDGVDVLRRLRAKPECSQLPIAVFTSSRSPRDREQALEFGASRCIEKPTQLDDFIAAINGVVRDLVPAIGTPAPPLE